MNVGRLVPNPAGVIILKKRPDGKGNLSGSGPIRQFVNPVKRVNGAGQSLTRRG